MFELRGVSKAYGSVHALRGIDLAIAPGRTTVLIGPSGCGKSSVLRLMAGLVRATAGEVWFEGLPVTPGTLPALRRRMGYVTQEGGLFPHLTGLANVTLMARHLGWPVERRAARVAELCRLARLEETTLGRYPAEMSGGQRQRVSLVRALMLDPDVLLLDEPLGALDPMVRFDLQNDLREVFGALRKTVVMVTHDLAEAAFFADEVVLMRDGAIVQRGTPADLLERPADEFVRQFVRAQRATPAAGRVA
jgi:osmoprotectant transport system ATP-binding protein